MRTAVFLLVGLVLGTATRAEQPELTPQHQMQLATATDGSQELDEAALYPLLENAKWLDPADTTGAIPLDYQAVLKDPAAFRGKLVLIRGYVAAEPRSAGKLARPGPWDGHLQQWIIKLNHDPENHASVVVYLVAPPPRKNWPFRDTRVWMVARFYKVWDQPNVLNGKPMSFLVFVGNTLNVETAAGSSPGLFGTPQRALLTISLAVVLLIMLWAAARMLIARRHATFQQHMREDRALRDERRREIARRTPSAGEPLPENPADALEELERRGHDEEQ